MSLNPSILHRAQTELDSVIGTEHLPCVADYGRMPYVEAVVKEVVRWRPMLPLSIARRTAKDDVYQGYFIPKGTIVMPNSWYASLFFFFASERLNCMVTTGRLHFSQTQSTRPRSLSLNGSSTQSIRRQIHIRGRLGTEGGTSTSPFTCTSIELTNSCG